MKKRRMPWLKRKFKRNRSETAQSGEKKWYKQKFGILLEPNNMDEGVDGMVCQIMGRDETEVLQCGEARLSPLGPHQVIGALRLRHSKLLTHCTPLVALTSSALHINSVSQVSL
jgi:hypothetical protein